MAIEKLEIGSEVFVSTRWHNYLSTIARETKTMFITQNKVRIYKKNNSIVGDAGYVRLVTQEDKDMFEKLRLVKSLNDFNFNLLPLKTLRELKQRVENDNR